MSSKIVRKPVKKFLHDALATPITSGAWVQILAAIDVPVSEVEFYNSTPKVLKISLGSSGNEDSYEIAYYVLPSSHPIILPVEFKRGVRISAKAIGADADEGNLIFNFFG